MVPETELTSLTDEQVKAFDDARQPQGENLDDTALAQAIIDEGKKLSQQAEQDKQTSQEAIQSVHQEQLQQQKEAETKPASPQGEQATEKQQEQQVAEKPADVKVEQQEQKAVTFEDLQQKIGVKDPNSLANMYVQSVKKMHEATQKAAQTQRMPPNADVQVPQQPYVPTQQVDPQQELLDDFNRDPFGTLTKAFSVLDAPRQRELAELKLKQEVVNLSSSPDTVEFNTPEVQKEINAILDAESDTKFRYQTNPDRELRPIYERALGRVGRKSRVAMPATVKSPQVSQSDKSAAVVEGPSKPTPSQPFNPETADLGEVKNVILNLQRQLR